MKQKLRFHTVEAVDREIARMEDTLAHTSMPLSEEKKMVVAIKDLSKSRETVKEYGEMQSKISGEDGSRKAIIERLRAKDAEINAVKAEQQRIRGELDATRSKGDEVGADIPKMQEERNACYEVIKGKREEIRGLRAAHKKAEDEYWTREKLWRAYLKQEKQKQWEASVEERKAREEARKQWERENAPEPFEAEVTAADQLVAYLAKWDFASAEKHDDAAAAAKAAEAAAAAETAKAFEGLQLMERRTRTTTTTISSPLRHAGGRRRNARGSRRRNRRRQRVPTRTNVSTSPSTPTGPSRSSPSRRPPPWAVPAMLRRCARRRSCWRSAA